MSNETPHPATPRQRRRILIASGIAAATGGAAWLATPGAHTRDWPAGDPLTLDLARLAPSQLRTVNWQDRPVWILRRTPEQLAALAAHETQLGDPDSAHSIQPPYCRNRTRALNPEYFVAIGLCTHQGCQPAYDSKGRFLCPCHASRYDLAGRVFQSGPAPANLVIPAYRIDGAQLTLGADPQRG